MGTRERAQENYGGAGSGNFGHKGRKGKKGGSIAGGGGVALGGGGRGRGAGDDQDAANYTKLARDKAATAKAIEPAITKTVVGAVKENGGEMSGLDNRRKEAPSMERKIRMDVKESDGNLTPAEAAAKINDSVRYTAVFESDQLVAGAKKTQDALKADGWEQHDTKWKNFYGSGDAYDGYNTVMVNKTTGNRFELQYHTKKSLEIKGEVHNLYEQARVLPKGPERTALEKQMASKWEADDYQKPGGWENLPGKRMDQ